ncbi:hypothetical protein [Pseudorhodoferax sp.]|uniref:hypothetical protein n=1 Tax=Pseudorhodoferax sp. TaxID=1993553 RepID=UPI002DD67E6C|nr:hypothetical protein [Pseudorhodoferax sp.]
MVWMGFSAQEQAAEVCSETLAEQIQALQPGTAPSSGGSLDDHHLDDLPFQLLADLIGLLGPAEAVVTAGRSVRPDAQPPAGWLAPYLDRLHRPPIARA